MFDTVDAAYKELVNVACLYTTSSPFCQFFSDIRTSHNLSVEEFAFILDVNTDQVLKIEQDKIWGNVTPQMIIKLENLFNLKKGRLKNYLKQSCLVK
ncbi:MAG: helix-turn-helix transcriptional regulator [Thermoanaerobacteraceae bacterium]|nr:helix-turn-helix transcriptional regulator [Thermoanaerobacteraceae bacterium]